MLCPCGFDCCKCKEYKKSCAGCREIKGKVYWAEYMGTDVCPIFQCCVNEKNYRDCGACPDLPCHLYYDTQDPSQTKEEHEAGALEQVRNLKSQRKS
jgi:hypothetical protein